MPYTHETIQTVQTSLSPPPIISVWNVITTAFALVFVVVLAIYFTRWLAAGKFRKMGRNIKIIESVGLGQNNAIFLLKVGVKYVLIGASKESTNFLLEVNEDEIEIEEKSVEPGFTNVLNKFMKDKNDDRT